MWISNFSVQNMIIYWLHHKCNALKKKQGRKINSSQRYEKSYLRQVGGSHIYYGLSPLNASTTWSISSKTRSQEHSKVSTFTFFNFFSSKSLFHGQDEIKTTFYAYYLKAKLLLHKRTGFLIEIPNRIDTVNNKKCQPRPVGLTP